MFSRIIDDLQRAMTADAEIVERDDITVWLMKFASGLPLKLQHPRTGPISFHGVRFSGSAISAFDRYVVLSIEDLVEKYTRDAERKLAEVDPQELDDIAARATNVIISIKKRLVERANEVKGRLLAGPGKSAGAVQLKAAGIVPIDVRARLSARVTELRKKQPPPPPKPVWGWLENFAKTNPALSNVISFLIGAGIPATVTLLLGGH